MQEVNYINNFRSNLRQALDDQDLSLRAAAERCGITYAYLHRILAGQVSPSLEICDKIADALDFELPEMLLKKTPVTTS